MARKGDFSRGQDLLVGKVQEKHLRDRDVASGKCRRKA